MYICVCACVCVSVCVRERERQKEREKEREREGGRARFEPGLLCPLPTSITITLEEPPRLVIGHQ